MNISINGQEYTILMSLPRSYNLLRASTGSFAEASPNQQKIEDSKHIDAY